MLHHDQKTSKTHHARPEKSRANILQAARTEFARSGLGGARVDQIAKMAGINKRMLYRYFGNKDDLFCAVLEANYAHKRDSEKALELEQKTCRSHSQTHCTDVGLLPPISGILDAAQQRQPAPSRASQKIHKIPQNAHAFCIHDQRRPRQRGFAKDFQKEIGGSRASSTSASPGFPVFTCPTRYTLSAILGRNVFAPAARKERVSAYD
jgi:TetR/AcrR family transcriptional regulator